MSQPSNPKITDEHSTSYYNPTNQITDIGSDSPVIYLSGEQSDEFLSSKGISRFDDEKLAKAAFINFAHDYLEKKMSQIMFCTIANRIYWIDQFKYGVAYSNKDFTSIIEKVCELEYLRLSRQAKAIAQIDKQLQKYLQDNSIISND